MFMDSFVIAAFGVFFWGGGGVWLCPQHAEVPRQGIESDP